MNKIAMAIALVAIGSSSLALWWVEDLGKRMAQQEAKLGETHQLQTRLQHHLSAVEQRLTDQLASIQNSAEGISNTDDAKSSVSQVDLEKTLSMFTRSDDTNRQEINFLKSQRLLHQKEIADLKNELHLLKRDYGRLARDIGR